MRKPRLLKLLAGLSVGFLLFQFFLIRVFWKRDEVQNTVDTSKQAHVHVKPLQEPAQPAVANAVKIFVSACAELNIPVFLLEVDILSSLTPDKSPPTTFSNGCLFGCRQHVTFGCYYKYWDTQGIVRLLKSDFAIHSIRQADPRLHHDTIPTHFFLLDRGHKQPTAIQVVMFHSRLGSYFWHGAITPLSRLNRILPSSSSVTIYFGLYAGAYKKFEVDDVQVDNVTVKVPQPPDSFVQQIPHSRFIECNETQATKFAAQYGIDNSDISQKFQRKARQVMAKGKQLLDSLEIRFWLSSGTCLGWFRQCGIIPHSKDVDLGIWISDYNPQLIPTFQENGFKLKHMFGKISDSFELSFSAGDIKLDLFFFYDTPNYMWNGGTQAKTGNKYKYIFPRFTLCWTEFLDLRVRVPCDTLAYIEANYGPNWFRPVTEWDWKKSPSNVKENGVWPEKEWDQVIQVF